MLIRIKSSEVFQRSGTSKRGSAYTLREQKGYVVLGDEVRRITFRLPRDTQAYPVGDYLLQPSSFTTDAYDQLTLTDLVLKPVTKSNAG